MTTELTIPQQADKALAFAETRAKLVALATESARITEITNPDGYKECHARRMALKNARVDIQKIGKAAREDALAYQKAIIAKEKELVDIIQPEEARLAELQDAEDRKVQLAKEAAERAERERIEAVNRRFQDLRAIPLGAMSATAAEIHALIDKAEAVDPGAFPQDMQAAAQYEKRLAVTALRASLDARKAADAEAEKVRQEREELARLRAEADAVRAEADRLAQLDRDRLAAEARRAEEAARAERERAEAAARAEREEAQRQEEAARAEARRKEDAERAEAARKLQAEREKLESDKKAAAQAARSKAIAEATLLSAASEAVDLLRGHGLDDHLVTLKLAAAIGREPSATQVAA